MPLTLRDLKKAEGPIRWLIASMTELEQEHDRREIFMPKVINMQLMNPESELRDALKRLKENLDAPTWSDAPNVNAYKEDPDVRIGLGAIQEIYDALNKGKIYDTQNGLIDLPSVRFALRSFLAKQPSPPSPPSPPPEEAKPMTEEEEAEFWRVYGPIFEAEAALFGNGENKNSEKKNGEKKNGGKKSRKRRDRKRSRRGQTRRV